MAKSGSLYPLSSSLDPFASLRAPSRMNPSFRSSLWTFVPFVGETTVRSSVEARGVRIDLGYNIPELGGLDRVERRRVLASAQAKAARDWRAWPVPILCGLGAWGCAALGF